MLRSSPQAPEGFLRSGAGPCGPIDSHRRFHLLDVSERAVAVGRALGIDGGELELLRDAPPLHDIGKIAVPEAIIAKPGTLDDEERQFMGSHTEIGERIVGSAPVLQGAAAIVRAGHERWDGGGYPDGSSGDEIPVAAPSCSSAMPSTP